MCLAEEADVFLGLPEEETVMFSLLLCTLEFDPRESDVLHIYMYRDFSAVRETTN
jgi:hypothetical protein